MTCASWVSGARPPTRRTGPGAAAQRINALRRSPGRRVWQRGYYERIVGNDHELERIRVYIRVNPTRWAEDRENLDAVLEQMTYRE